MKLITVVNGRERTLEIANPASPNGFAIDGTAAQADVREVEPGVYSILVGARSFEVKIEEREDGYFVLVNGRRYEVVVRDPREALRRAAELRSEGPQQITSPMPGKVVRVLVKAGDQVEAGRGLVVVEAMKMQNEIKAPKAGTVTSLRVEEGASVSAGEVMAVVE